MIINLSFIWLTNLPVSEVILFASLLYRYLVLIIRSVYCPTLAKEASNIPSKFELLMFLYFT